MSDDDFNKFWETQKTIGAKHRESMAALYAQDRVEARRGHEADKAYEALNILRSMDLGLYHAHPEIKDAIRAARSATGDLTKLLARRSWSVYKGWKGE